MKIRELEWKKPDVNTDDYHPMAWEAHPCKDVKYLVTTDDDGKTFEAAILYEDESDDFAIFKTVAGAKVWCEIQWASHARKMLTYYTDEPCDLA